MKPKVDILDEDEDWRPPKKKSKLKTKSKIVTKQDNNKTTNILENPSDEDIFKKVDVLCSEKTVIKEEIDDGPSRFEIPDTGVILLCENSETKIWFEIEGGKFKKENSEFRLYGYTWYDEKGMPTGDVSISFSGTQVPLEKASNSIKKACLSNVDPEKIQICNGCSIRDLLRIGWTFVPFEMHIYASNIKLIRWLKFALRDLFDAMAVLMPSECLDLIRPFSNQLISHLRKFKQFKCLMPEAEQRLKDPPMAPLLRRKLFRKLAILIQSEEELLSKSDFSSNLLNEPDVKLKMKKVTNGLRFELEEGDWTEHTKLFQIYGLEWSDENTQLTDDISVCFTSTNNIRHAASSIMSSCTLPPDLDNGDLFHGCSIRDLFREEWTYAAFEFKLYTSSHIVACWLKFALRDMFNAMGVLMPSEALLLLSPFSSMLIDHLKQFTEVAHLIQIAKQRLENPRSRLLRQKVFKTKALAYINELRKNGQWKSDLMISSIKDQTDTQIMKINKENFKWMRLAATTETIVTTDWILKNFVYEEGCVTSLKDVNNFYLTTYNKTRILSIMTLAKLLIISFTNVYPQRILDMDSGMTVYNNVRFKDVNNSNPIAYFVIRQESNNWFRNNLIEQTGEKVPVHFLRSVYERDVKHRLNVEGFHRLTRLITSIFPTTASEKTSIWIDGRREYVECYLNLKFIKYPDEDSHFKIYWESNKELRKKKKILTKMDIYGQAAVEWMKDVIEVKKGSSLSFDDLFNAYKAHFKDEAGLTNTGLLGIVIRKAFDNVVCTRLGVSKYENMRFKTDLQLSYPKSNNNQKRVRHQNLKLMAINTKIRKPHVVSWMQKNLFVKNGSLTFCHYAYGIYIKTWSNKDVEVISIINFGKIIKELFPNCTSRRRLIKINETNSRLAHCYENLQYGNPDDHKDEKTAFLGKIASEKAIILQEREDIRKWILRSFVEKPGFEITSKRTYDIFIANNPDKSKILHSVFATLLLEVFPNIQRQQTALNIKGSKTVHGVLYKNFSIVSKNSDVSAASESEYQAINFTVNWLERRYEVKTGSMVLRNEEYKRYTLECKNHTPLSTFLFGKQIIAAFASVYEKEAETINDKLCAERDCVYINLGLKEVTKLLHHETFTQDNVMEMESIKMEKETLLEEKSVVSQIIKCQHNKRPQFDLSQKRKNETCAWLKENLIYKSDEMTSIRRLYEFYKKNCVKSKLLPQPVIEELMDQVFPNTKKAYRKSKYKLGELNIFCYLKLQIKQDSKGEIFEGINYQDRRLIRNLWTIEWLKRSYGFDKDGKIAHKDLHRDYKLSCMNNPPLSIIRFSEIVQTTFPFVTIVLKRTKTTDKHYWFMNLNKLTIPFKGDIDCTIITKQKIFTTTHRLSKNVAENPSCNGPPTYRSSAYNDSDLESSLEEDDSDTEAIYEKKSVETLQLLIPVDDIPVFKMTSLKTDFHASAFAMVCDQETRQHFCTVLKEVNLSYGDFVTLLPGQDCSDNIMNASLLVLCQNSKNTENSAYSVPISICEQIFEGNAEVMQQLDMTFANHYYDNRYIIFPIHLSTYGSRTKGHYNVLIADTQQRVFIYYDPFGTSGAILRSRKTNNECINGYLKAINTMLEKVSNETWYGNNEDAFLELKYAEDGRIPIQTDSTSCGPLTVLATEIFITPITLLKQETLKLLKKVYSTHDELRLELFDRLLKNSDYKAVKMEGETAEEIKD